MPIPSDYNAVLRSLGLPEEPDCEECGLQIRRNYESPVTYIRRGEDGRAFFIRFCSATCAADWSKAGKG